MGGGGGGCGGGGRARGAARGGRGRRRCRSPPLSRSASPFFCRARARKILSLTPTDRPTDRRTDPQPLSFFGEERERTNDSDRRKNERARAREERRNGKRGRSEAPWRRRGGCGRLGREGWLPPCAAAPLALVLPCCFSVDARDHTHAHTRARAAPRPPPPCRFSAPRPSRARRRKRRRRRRRRALMCVVVVLLCVFERTPYILHATCFVSNPILFFLVCVSAGAGPRWSHGRVASGRQAATTKRRRPSLFFFISPRTGAASARDKNHAA